MNNLEIIPFEPQKHFDEVYEMWQIIFGDSWPLDRETFTRLLDVTNTRANLETFQFVAFRDEALVGFVAIQISKAATINGIINLVLVSPQYQRQGIGSTLHNYAIEWFKKAGVKRAQLGGGFPTIWQGIPVEMSEAAAFFNKMGWEYSENSYDLTQDLQQFQNSQQFLDLVADRAVSFQLATLADKEAIISFQKAEFPHWLPYYEEIMETGEYGDILLVKDAELKILGMLTLYSSSSNPGRFDVIWKAELGENAGSLGCVGIARKAHRQGLGSAMVAYANDILKARGVGNCFISWTFRPNFYRQVGYKLWKSYHMSGRTLP